MVHTHADTQVTDHDLPGSLSVRLPLVALLLDAVLRLPRFWPTTVRQSPMEPANGSPTETQQNLEQALAMGPRPFRVQHPARTIAQLPRRERAPRTLFIRRKFLSTCTYTIMGQTG